MATQIAERSGNLEPQVLQMSKRDLWTTERIIFSWTQWLWLLFVLFGEKNSMGYVEST